jgi:hypothetical protein
MVAVESLIELDMKVSCKRRQHVGRENIWTIWLMNLQADKVIKIKVYCEVRGCDTVCMGTYFSKDHTASVFRMAAKI